MPELPEVETTLRGISPHLIGQKVSAVHVRQPRLRWPVPDELAQILTGQTIDAVKRRAKYLLLHTDAGSLMIHLGMSGSLRIVESGLPPNKHDHVDICLEDELTLRFRDPRRFGSMLWLNPGPASHPLLDSLGPEPFSVIFNGEYLYRLTRKRRVAVKQLIMNSQVVVGVGNIYANEALFRAGIRPDRAAGRISHRRYEDLAACIRKVLNDAIEQGGTTLRDFSGGDGQPGYFRQSLHVYGRGNQTCTKCLGPLKEIRLGQRSTVFCSRCQT
jgi:formamidopyrimidine-DNA glycosylase